MKGQDEASAGTLERVQTKCKADFSLSLQSRLHWWEHRPSKSYTEVLCKYSHFLSKEEERSLPPSRQEQCLLVFLAIINHDQNKLLPWNWRPSDKRIPMCVYILVRWRQRPTSNITVMLESLPNSCLYFDLYLITLFGKFALPLVRTRCFTSWYRNNTAGMRSAIIWRGENANVKKARNHLQTRFRTSQNKTRLMKSEGWVKISLHMK